MDEKAIIIKPKTWFKIFEILSGIICIAMGPAILYLMFYTPNGKSFVANPDSMEMGLIILLTVMSLGLCLMGVYVTLDFRNKEIILDENGVWEKGLVSKVIPYSDIKKISVKKGLIKIKGSGFFKSISFGDLYTNFDTGHKVLAYRIKRNTEIEFKGSESHIDNYFG